MVIFLSFQMQPFHAFFGGLLNKSRLNFYFLLKRRVCVLMAPINQRVHYDETGRTFHYCQQREHIDVAKVNTQSWTQFHRLSTK